MPFDDVQIRNPYGISGPGADYHAQLFPTPPPAGSWIRFKVISAGWNIARRLWDLRLQAVASLPSSPGGEHRVIAIWMPHTWYVGCADCSWLTDKPRERNHNHRGEPITVVREAPRAPGDEGNG